MEICRIDGVREGRVKGWRDMYRIVLVYNMQRNPKLVYWIVGAMFCRAVLFAFEPAMRMEEDVMDERNGGGIFWVAGI